MSTNLILRVAAVVTVFVSAYACTTSQSAGTAAAEDAIAPFRCGAEHPVITKADSSLTIQGACALVNSAIRVFRDSAPEPFRQQSDTAFVSEARIVAQVIRDWETDSVIGDWWIVTLELPGQQFNVDVRLDKSTNAAQLQTVHKPMGQRTPD